MQSQEEKIRMLLEGVDILDRKPSQFSRHLQDPAGPEELVQSIWLNHTPQELRAILASTDDKSVSKMVKTADPIV